MLALCFRGQGQRTTCQSQFSPPTWEQLMSADLMAFYSPFIRLLIQQIPVVHGNKTGAGTSWCGEVISLSVPREVALS